MFTSLSKLSARMHACITKKCLNSVKVCLFTFSAHTCNLLHMYIALQTIDDKVVIVFQLSCVKFSRYKTAAMSDACVRFA